LVSIKEDLAINERAKFDYTSYNCIHTFITKIKNVEANEYLLKLMVGHRIEDVTEKLQRK